VKIIVVTWRTLAALPGAMGKLDLTWVRVIEAILGAALAKAG
jgi:hypothetical protein